LPAVFAGNLTFTRLNITFDT